MSKFIMIAETSDKGYSTVISAEHSTKRLKQFNKDWGECYEKVCSIDFNETPGNTCEEQYRLMKKLGWKIKELPLEDTVTLP
jgi:hypothetical protein